MGDPLSLPEKPRLLVVALRRLGDVLLTTPLIRSLRRAWPKAAVDVLVFAGTETIIQGNPDINNVISMHQRPGAAETLALMRRLFKRYHLAVSTQPGDRPTFFCWLAGRTTAGLINRGGPTSGRAIKTALLSRNIAAEPDIHRVEQMLRMADMLGIARDPTVVLPTPAPPGFAPGDRYAVIHAAPMFRYKEWTAEGWRALAAGLKQRGLSIVAIGGPDPAERRQLDSIWQGQLPIHQLPWPQNVALLQKARLYVGPDTSVSHVAAAAGCPTVVLFGPTDARVWGPWPAKGLATPWQISGTIQNRGNVWLVQNPLPCMPCLLEGCERHIGSDSSCLQELKAEQVLAAADQALAGAVNNRP